MKTSETTKSEEFTNVKENFNDTLVQIKISSKDKPEIIPELIIKWQQMIDIAAKIIHVPAALIRKIHPDHFETLISSKNDTNPIPAGKIDPLRIGAYCESAVASCETTIISNAGDPKQWQPNIDFNPSLIAYIGFPLLWPDGEIFGTLCSLDSKENEFNGLYQDLLRHFKQVIELDLRLLMEREELRQTDIRKELHIREIHHRIKNNFSLLIGIIQLRIDEFPRAETFLRDIEARIRAISTVHENIYRAEDVTSLPLSGYIKDLTQSIVDNYFESEIDVKISGDSFPISSDNTMLVGLMINELTTNALKYAFAGQPNPKLSVIIRKDSESEFSIIFSDNGPGLPETFSTQDTDSLGMVIIKSTVLQMNGSWQVDSTCGACFSFKLQYDC